MRRVSDWFEGLTLIRPNERWATLLSFVMVFVLMAAYFVLRPVRDAMASDWSDAEVSLLWNLQLLLSIGLVALYSLAVSHWPLRRIVPGVYTLFALSFIGFWLATPLVSNVTLLEKAFYLWVAAFSLFNLSVFWSFMSDTFDAEQSRRLFAIIASGASAGAIVGPAIPTLFASYLGLDQLMLIAALGVLAVVPIILVLQRMKSTTLGNSDHRQSGQHQHAPIDLRWWSGFRDVVSNPYLRAIGVFILLYVFIGSFVYFIQKNLLAEFTRVERTQILSGVSWLVNTLTFACALLVTGRLVNRAGMVSTLVCVPLALLAGMAAIALAPFVVVLLAVDVVRRVGNYAVTRPAREMLFTQVTPDQRFKAKQVLDVVVYRGGDAASGSIFALLSEGLGLALAAMALIGSVVAGLWALVGVYLGRRYQNVRDQTGSAIDESSNSTAMPVSQPSFTQ
ncbi:MAG: MFS transporter [Wenzhouxiangellaceae bacterium]